MLMVVVALFGLAQAELIVNGDFEAGAWGGGGSGSGEAFGWTTMPPVLVPSGGSDGGAYTRLDTTPADFSGSWGWAWSAVWSNRVAVSVGDEYLLSGMARHISDGNTLRGFIKYYDAAGNTVDYDGNGVIENNSDRLHLYWPTGSEWGAFGYAITVPAVDLKGNPFDVPISQFDVVFSVETEEAVIGIDEISCGVFQGEMAKVPVPEDGTNIVDPSVILSWRAPVLIASPTYNVYLGTQPGNLQQVGADQSNLTFDPYGQALMQEATTYFWRVDSIDDNGGNPIIYTGDEWSFTTLTRPVHCPEYDVISDCMVGFDDLFIMLLEWMAAAGSQADIVGNDGVGIEDFNAVSQSWLQGIGIEVVISEFLASNGNSIDDADGDSSDWIELYNATSAPIDISGWFLTDTTINLKKWKIPDSTVLQAYDFLVIFASNKNRRENINNLHTNFELDLDGEFLALVKSDGTTVSHQYASIYPVQRKDVSYGMFSDTQYYFANPTPGTANDPDTYTSLVESVDFNPERGFYSTGFAVTISCDTPGASIYYTFDGSEPDETDTPYTAPVTISSSNNTLRARAIKPGGLSPNPVTHTYLINQSTSIKSLPAIVITGDEQKTLYEPDGIMAIVGGHYLDTEEWWNRPWVPDGPDDYNNPMQRGFAYERPISFEFIEPADNSGFQIDCGIRVQGSDWHRPRYTRGSNWSTNYDKFSFKFFFRNRYSGTKELEYRLIPINPYDHFDALAIRGGHNDTYNPFIRDELARRLHYDMGWMASLGTLANLYINGSYKAYYNPCERLDEEFFKKWNDSDHDWDVITQRTARNGDYVAWNALLNYARNKDLSVQSHYDEVGNRMDITSFIDYLILQIYTSNWDWPGNNWAVARERSAEGKFTFHVWDAEGGFVNVYSSAFDDYNGGLNGQDTPNAWLYRALKANSYFRQFFADRINKHFFGTGALTNDHIVDRFNELYDKMIGIRPDMDTYIRDGWVSNRRPWILSKFQEQDVFTFQGPGLRVNGAENYGGNIQSGDTLSFTNPVGTGTVYYMLDGTDPRLPDGAIAPGAQTFNAGTSSPVTFIPQGSTWSYLDNGSDQGTTWQGGNEPFSESGWGSGPAELGYGDGDEATTVSYGPDPGNKYVTTYFRHHFNVTDASQVSDLVLDIVRDDGAVVYINGTEAGRTNMPGGTITYSTLSSSGTGDETAFYNIPGASAGMLVDGDNVVAVEIHQVNRNNSSDISFNLTLDGTITSGGGSPVSLTGSKYVKARIKDGADWSGLTEAFYAVGPVAENLRISEIMYHPADPNMEFIELTNIGAEAIDLAWVKFTNGIDFTFPSLTLSPGGYCVVVENSAEFTSEYGGGITIAGQFTGKLDNDEETIELADAAGTVIHDFKYKDGWYAITDGSGFSLTVIDPANPDLTLWDDNEGYRPSAAVGGSPGSDDSGSIPVPDSIVISEVLAHSHALDPDWIELHNTTASEIYIGGWFLSDNDDDDPNRMKYEIATGTSILANDYKVFYQDVHFGNPTDPGSNHQFALSEGGETLYLHSGQGGQITGYYQEQQFDASATNVSIGRYTKSAASGYDIDFVAMETNTPDAVNSAPKVGPVVINEIMYHPLDPDIGDPFTDDDDFEYIELYNITASPVVLQEYDTIEGINVPWEFTKGIDYTFPLGTTIPANGYLILAKNPAGFNYRHTVPGGTQVLGPYDAKLDNGGEKLELSLPADKEGSVRYYIRVDQINYDDIAPWPTGPDGTGDALERKVPADYGNDVQNWQTGTPTPGEQN